MCLGNCNDVVHFYYNDSQPLHNGRRDLFVLYTVALEFLYYKNGAGRYTTNTLVLFSIFYTK
jgi:hypothetical protein